ncbi:MAG: hypothetical protein WCJ01_05300 [Ignavibacteria bacterium]
MTIKDFESLLQPGIFNFIEEHKSDNAGSFALKYASRKDFPVRAIAEQIACRQKAKLKLPSFEGNHLLLYDKTALEQASSESTALEKTLLLQGRRIIDLTGGLGIDDYFISGNFEELIYCEANPVLAGIAKYNFSCLHKTNIIIKEGNSIEILGNYEDNYFDWIYIDPSRRDASKRFIKLQDCSPDVVKHKDILLSKSRSVMIKVSPAYEFSEAKKYFPELSEFIIVSLDNECKEALLILTKEKTDNTIYIKAVMVDSVNNNSQIIYDTYNSNITRPIVATLQKYFFEPDAAIIKARLSLYLTLKHPLLFINSSVDYLTGNEPVKNFPGRTFIIKDVINYNKKEIKKYFRNNRIVQANIARRDFPDAPDMIKKNFNLSDGGNNYLFFTKNASGGLIVIVCNKP